MSTPKSHGQIIIDAAAARNNRVYPAGMLLAGSFGPNEDSERPGEYSAVLSGDGVRAVGEVTVTYDRLELADVVAALDNGGIALRTSGASYAEVATLLREQMGVNILDTDLEEGSLSAPEVISNVTVAAAQDSRLFKGALPITIAPFYGDETGLALINNGREPLFPVDNIVEATVVEDISLPEEALKGDGTLLIGSGNPDGNFVSASNGELTIAMGARVYQVGSNLPVPQDLAYSYQIEDTQDWNFLFSLSMHNAPEGRRLVDVYDVAMTWVQQSTGHSITWSLQDRDGAMVLVSDDENMVISDSATGPTGIALQNIQRMRHYIENNDQAYFSPDQLNSFGALLGSFTFTVSAIRKNSLVDPLVLSTNVSVTLVEEEVPE